MSDTTSQTAAKRAEARYIVPPTSIRKIEADGVQVFYRAAGDPSAPVVLLLHGFPASSFMFRELIPRLADRVPRDRARSAGFRIYRSSGDGEIIVHVRSIGAHDRGFHGHSRSTATQSMCSTMARQPASVWRWLTRSESQRSFRRMETRMKKALAMPGVRSGKYWAHPRQRIATYSAKVF